MYVPLSLHYMVQTAYTCLPMISGILRVFETRGTRFGLNCHIVITWRPFFKSLNYTNVTKTKLRGNVVH